MNDPAVSDALCRHLSAVSFEQLPAPAVDAARRSLLDALGVMLGASGMGEGCGAFVDLARACGGPGDCELIGYGERAALLPGVLANGSLAHALDFEDAFDAAPCHPNAALIPVALALAQARGPVSGRELLASIASGCDLVCRLALALRSDPAEYGWYTPAILGAFGAAAAAARLLRLSATATRDALSLTLCQATCSAELKYSRRSVVRAVRDGFAAQAGLLSALLAERGVAGFDAPIEGRAGLYALYARGAWSAEALLERLGRQFHGAEVSFKPWPSCRGTHAFIEGALALRSAHRIDIRDVEFVHTRGGRVQSMLVEPREQKLNPETAIDAKFSIPFTVALALVHGEVTLERFGPQALQDETVRAAARRVFFEIDPDAGAADATAGSIEIGLRDGRRLVARVEHPRGHPLHPMSWQELAAKFHMCARHAHRPVPTERAAALIETIRGLESVEDCGRVLTLG